MNGRRHLRVTARSFGIGHLEHHRAPADAEKGYARRNRPTVESKLIYELGHQGRSVVLTSL